MSRVFFAWVDPEEVFGAEHFRNDEDVFDFRVDHAEGEIATLTVDIPNPHIGLLNPSRKFWVFFSYDDGTTVTLMFAGRQVGMPDNLLGEDITLQFSGKPLNYQILKQKVAEGLKVFPEYDPLFLSEERRDDPDAILQGYSKAWHVDRLTGEVTVSDVLEGEDGTEVFTEDETPYDSVNLTFDRPPLTEVEIVADVTWSQEFSGYVNIGTRSFDTYAGDGILQDWPKALQTLEGGWSAALATAVDVWRIERAQTITRSYDWQNSAKKHNNGDTLSLRTSDSAPNLPNGSLSRVITYTTTTGFIDPFAKDSDGDPAPINIPESSSLQTTYVPKWRVNTALVVRYDAKRQRSEKAHITLTADVQPILTDDGSVPGSELITLNGGDVGQPILNVLNWSSVAGAVVTLGQIIFPDVSTVGKTAQIATTAGTAGTEPPAFSDITGTTTADGSVVWTSLGTTSSLGSAPDWKASATTPKGTVVLPRRPVSIPYEWLVQQGRLDSPPVGTNVNVGTIIESGGTFQQCTTSGTTGTATPGFSGTAGVTTADGNAVWTSLGTDLPLGSVYFIATTGGVSGATLPGFANTTGATTSDGSVVWTSLGTADVPIGGWPGHTGRNAYFPTDRGLLSIGYALARGRALLRLRSRIVKLTWEIDFERALGLSCRMNAMLEDRRLPSGSATGKIIAYSITGNGDSAKFSGSVTIGCAVGNGVDVTPGTGGGGYVQPGYVSSGYVYSGEGIVPLDDIAFTPPIIGTNPDDLVFPLGRSDAVKFELVHGSLAEQTTAVNAALNAAAAAAQQHFPGQDYLLQFQTQQNNTRTADSLVRDALKAVPIWYELELTSLVGGPFQADYFIDATPLAITKMIDLAAESSA